MQNMFTVNVTSNYSIFEAHENNRNIKDNRKFKALLKSMKSLGFLPFLPIWCKSQSNGKLSIQIGHHRFEAARMLKIPVCYMVYDTNFPIFAEDESTNGWSLKDYIDCQVRDGNTVSLQIKKYHEETGIGLRQVVNILGGEIAGGGNKTARLKRGEFKIDPKAWERAEKVRMIIEAGKKIDAYVATHPSFIAALTRILFVDDFCPDTFVLKLQSRQKLFKPQLDKVEYGNMIENIYNHGTAIEYRTPLTFLANKVMAKRKKYFGKCSNKHHSLLNE